MKAIMGMSIAPTSTTTILIALTGEIGWAAGWEVGVLVAEMRGSKVVGVVGDGERVKVGAISATGVGVAIADQGVGVGGGA